MQEIPEDAEFQQKIQSGSPIGLLSNAKLPELMDMTIGDNFDEPDIEPLDRNSRTPEIIDTLYINGLTKSAGYNFQQKPRIDHRYQTDKWSSTIPMHSPPRAIDLTARPIRRFAVLLWH